MRPVLKQLNWGAILVATLVYYLVGIPIFSLFGDVWDAAGFKKPEGWQSGAQYYLGPLVANCVVVVCTAALARIGGAVKVRDGVVLGLVVALGYLVPTAGVDAMSPAHPDPMKIFLITGAYHLVGLVIAAVIVTVWTKNRRDAEPETVAVRGR
jgi:hypothetical protein